MLTNKVRLLLTNIAIIFSPPSFFFATNSAYYAAVIPFLFHLFKEILCQQKIMLIPAH